MRYQLASLSLPGARPTNEDRVAVAERDNAVLMVLADGLGGHAGGALAAETLTQTLVRAFQTVRAPLIERPSAFLALSILQAHRLIVNLGRRAHPPLEPRTTCVACLVQNGYAYWAHVGDSRLYHLRDGRVLYRTFDHTTIEQLRRDGLLSEAEMNEHPQKSRLLKCVGGPKPPTIALGEETLLKQDDILLLVSDGVWEAFTPEELAAQMDRPGPLEEHVEELLAAAERRMRTQCDNVSAVALRWEAAASAAGLPLQGNPAIEIDGEALLENIPSLLSRRTRAAARPTPAASADGGTDRRGHKPIEREIRELEEYLKALDTRYESPDTS
jgi:serine/threonine protein phosphatase PrpC